MPRSGALDRIALDLANRLVGNTPDAAGLELAHGRFRARFDADAVVAVTGAPASVSPAGFGVAQHIRAGQVLQIGSPSAGVYVYLAVSGGIDVPPVLGSRSTDTLSGLGPSPVRRGDRLAMGLPSSIQIGESAAPVPIPGEEVRVRIRFGPRDDWFTDPAALLRNTYRVTTGNRIGARLDGQPLERSKTQELPSEGLMAGAIQVPGNGLPIVFLADHPTTGGYPVIGVVHPDDLRFIAQARPGTSVVFCGP